MICDWCALAADIDADPTTPLPDGEPPAGHSPAVCRDFGREIRGCTCQHRPPQDPDTPQEDA